MTDRREVNSFSPFFVEKKTGCVIHLKYAPCPFSVRVSYKMFRER